MKNLIPLILLCSIFLVGNAQQKTARFFFNSGAGLSYSLFYKNGGVVRDFGPANTANHKISRNIFGFSQFIELEYRLKNSRWSLRAGYATHRFYPQFKKKGYTTNGTYYDIDIKEADRNAYPQITIQYALFTGTNRLEIGTGFYNQIKKLQTINYYDNMVVSGNNPGGNAIFIQEHTGVEAGFPVNLDYVHFLKKGNGIGARLNFNYTQSVQRAEHISLQVFFKTKLK